MQRKSEYENPTAGLADPYWYEWLVGLKEIVSMLDPSSGIESVTIQAYGLQGIDDVVVQYEDKRFKFIQVKHTREENTLTFGDMIASNENGVSLLRSLSQAWKKIKNNGVPHEVHLYSNREIGKKRWTAPSGYTRPPLNEFWKFLNVQLSSVEDFNTLTAKIPDEWNAAWADWCAQLDHLESEEEKLQFLVALKIHLDQPDLEDIEQEILIGIKNIFQINAVKQQEILKDFIFKLRIWSTSRRGQGEKITRKIAYNALCLEDEEIVGWHGFKPPEPFFVSFEPILNQLENELLTGENRVVFFQGLPGSGKTSIVSKLCQRGNVIDLRFHAFYPITPGSMQIHPDYGVYTASETLWGDLLCQLRRLLSDSLYEYRVPIRKDFLNAHQLRDEVLRLADAVAKRQGRPTIICIDGIDHASRSNDINFLNSLVPPDKIPDNVRFLIVGQPPNQKYPNWLRIKRSDVTSVIISELKEEDVLYLIKANAPEFDINQHAAAVKVIMDQTEGNTLATVFAVHEAACCRNAEELKERLLRNHLNSDLTSYYESIWNNTIEKLPSFPIMLSEKLAACLTLISERLTGKMLNSIFKQAFTEDDGILMLQRLYPLVIEEESGFRIMHNDVRVCLKSLLGISGDVLKQTASYMADYYWSNPSASSVVKHRDLFRFLNIAEREKDYALVYNSDYVKEAWKIRCPFKEVVDQTKLSLVAAVSTRDWNVLHNVTLGITTFDSIYNSTKFLKKDFDHGVELPPLLLSERQVTPLKGLEYQQLFQLIKEGYLLIQSGEKQRAYEMIKRLMGTQNPEEVLVYFPNSSQYWDGPIAHKDSLQEMMQLWGRLYMQLGIPFNLKGILKKDLQEREDIGAIQRIELFNWAYLDEAIEMGYDFFVKCLYKGIFLSSDGYENVLQRLVQANQWEMLSEAMNNIEYFEDTDARVFLEDQLFLWSLLSRDQSLINKHHPKEDRFIFYFKGGMEEEVEVERIALRCLLFGWLKEDLEIDRLAKSLSDAFDDAFKNSCEYRMDFFRGACLTGKWLHALRDQDHLVGITISPDDFRTILKTILAYKEFIGEGCNETRVLKLMFQTFISFMSREGLEVYWGIMREEIINHARQFPYDNLLEIVWRYLYQQKQESLLIKWADEYVGNKGMVWNCRDNTVDERAGRFLALMMESNMYKDAEQVIQRQYIYWASNTLPAAYYLKVPSYWVKQILLLNDVIPEEWIFRLIWLIGNVLKELKWYAGDSDIIISQEASLAQDRIDELILLLIPSLVKLGPNFVMYILRDLNLQNDSISEKILVYIEELLPSYQGGNRDYGEQNQVSEAEQFKKELDNPLVVDALPLPNVTDLSFSEMSEELDRLHSKRIRVKLINRIRQWALRLYMEQPSDYQEHIESLVQELQKCDPDLDWHTPNGHVLEPIASEIVPEQSWRLVEHIVKTIEIELDDYLFFGNKIENLYALIVHRLSLDDKTNLSINLLETLLVQEQWSLWRYPSTEEKYKIPIENDYSWKDVINYLVNE